MRASAPVISVALPCSGVLDPKQILYICTLTYSSTPKSSTEKKKKKEKKNSRSQDQAALQQHELYKTCAFAASEIKMHRFQRQLHQFSQNLLPINYCSRYLELNSAAAAAAASYCVPARFEIRGKSRGTSASTNSAKLRSWYY
jgi:hypothetical protein